MTNHYILQFLANRHAWIYTPSRPDEKRLGYDASLQGYKVAAVQYKKVQRVNKSDGGVSIKIDKNQHQRLVSNFPPLSHPYVFYSFSAYHNYKQIDADFRKIGSPWFFFLSLFFDAHAFPVGTTSVRLWDNGNLKAFQPTTRYSGTIQYYRGPKWATLLKQCHVGERASMVSEVAGFDVPEEVLPPRLNYLYYPMPRDSNL